MVSFNTFENMSSYAESIWLSYLGVVSLPPELILQPWPILNYSRAYLAKDWLRHGISPCVDPLVRAREECPVFDVVHVELGYILHVVEPQAPWPVSLLPP